MLAAALAALTTFAASASADPLPFPTLFHEYVSNGDFESAAGASYSSIAPWVKSGTVFFGDLGFGAPNFCVPSRGPSTNHCAVELGGINSTVGEINQVLTIPARGTSGPTFTYWIDVLSDEPNNNAIPYDTLEIDLLDASGGRLLMHLATNTNLQKSGPNATFGQVGSWRPQGPHNLAAFRGQTVMLRFRAFNDSIYPTTFRLDDISIGTIW